MNSGYSNSFNANIVIAGHFDMDETYATYREQGTEDWLLILTLSGCGYTRVDGEETLLKPGVMVLFEPHAHHDYGLKDGGHWELQWVHFTAPLTWAPLLAWPLWRNGVRHLSCEDSLPELQQAFETLVQDSTGYSKHRERLASNALERLILRCDELNALSQEGVVDRRILRVASMLTHNLAEAVTLTSLSRYCHLSPSRMSHLFTEQLGVSPRTFLERQRLERAKELLTHTTLPVAQIAKQVGFDSSFYFSRRFKRYVSLSPRDFRNRQT